MKERQTSFAGGEFSPSLWGRSDLQAYATGAKTLRNFYVNPEGVLLNRPGTHHVARIFERSPAGVAGAPSRPVPFVFSATDALMLLFGNGRMAAYRAPSEEDKEHSGTHNYEDWQIKQADGTAVEVHTPYTVVPDSELQALRFAQIGNILTVVHPEHAPRNLKRLTEDSRSWTFEEQVFSIPGFPIEEGQQEICGRPHILTTATHDYGTHDSPPRAEEEFAHISKSVTGISKEAWQWQVTRIMRRADGREYETAPISLTSQMHRRFRPWREGRHYRQGWGADDETMQLSKASMVVLNPAQDPSGAYADVFFVSRLKHISYVGNVPPNTEYWRAKSISELDVPPAVVERLPERVTLASNKYVFLDWRVYPQLCPDGRPATEDAVVATRIYRGLEGVAGYIGSTTKNFFYDRGDAPDVSSPPPAGLNPFEVLNPDGSVLRTEHPRTVAYHQNRLLLGGTNERPATLFGSAVGNYLDHDEVIPANDADALKLEIAGKRLESIQALIPRRELLVMGANSEWALTGSSGYLITPNSIAAYPMTQHGCGDIEPEDIEGAVIFMTFKGTQPKALVFSDEAGGQRSVDIARMSKHLFTGHQIVSWAYAEDPHSVLWAVRDDGILLSLTISFEEQMAAWAHHDLGGGGFAVHVSTIPEGTEDSVYLVVRRGDDYNLERLSSRVLTDIRDAVFLDASVTKGYRTVGDAIRVTSGDLTPNEDVEFSYFDVTGAGVTAAGVLEVGDVLQVESGGVVGRFQIRTLGVTSEGTVLETLPADVKTESLAFTTCFDTVGGLRHLNGQEVYALVDGHVAGPYTVKGSGVDLGFKAAIATVGLAITSEFESLAAVADRTKRKNVRSITVETEGSRGGYVGSTLDGPMEEMRDRDVDHGYGAIPLTRSETPFVVSAEWEEQATCAIRQTDPLPLEILGLTRDFELGG